MKIALPFHPAGIPVVVNVATGAHLLKGQARLIASMKAAGQMVIKWSDDLPEFSPTHAERPFAFKAYALGWAAMRGFRRIMWCDASIVANIPPEDSGSPFARRAALEPIWAWASKHGAWISNNGYTNYEWTAESAYPALFELESALVSRDEQLHETNRNIPHVVAGAFAVDLDHPTGNAVFEEYCRLGMETSAFVGPTWNLNHPDHGKSPGAAPCGPADVRGHRHDQSALSVIAWRYGVPLSDTPDGPNLFAYPADVTAETCLIADGNY